MYSYFAYGLGIHSTFPLPELAPAESNPDIIIRRDHLSSVPPAVTKEGIVSAAPAETLLHYSSAGFLLIRNGSEIVVDPFPNADEQQIRLFLVGTALAVLLHQRGRLVLHASAVEACGGAVAFLGAPGCGKSTTAALFRSRGYPLVADDVIAVSFDEHNVPFIDPAFPLIKIWPEAAAALGENVSAAPRVTPSIEKRVQQIDGRFSRAAVELKRIYVLAEGERTEVQALEPQPAFMELVRHTFVIHLVGPTGTTAAHFQQCSLLATSIPVRLLKRRLALDSLGEIAERVEEDLGADPGLYASGPYAA